MTGVKRAVVGVLAGLGLSVGLLASPASADVWPPNDWWEIGSFDRYEACQDEGYRLISIGQTTQMTCVQFYYYGQYTLFVAPPGPPGGGGGGGGGGGPIDPEQTS